MSEQHTPPSPDRLDTTRLGERSLREWHQFLVTNPDTGEDARNARTFSHYGRTSAECAWWAIAGEIAFEEASGTHADEREAGLDYLMSLAVNDHPDLAELVKSYSYAIPAELLNLCELEGDV